MSEKQANRYGTLLLLISPNDESKLNSLLSSTAPGGEVWRVLRDKLVEKGFRNLFLHYLEINGAGPCVFTHYEFMGSQTSHDNVIKDIKQQDYYKRFITDLNQIAVLAGASFSENLLWGRLLEEMFHCGQYVTEYSASTDRPVKYVCGAIGLVRQEYDKYRKLHTAFEYIGTDFSSDMTALGGDEKVKEWWVVCDSCMDPLTWEGPPPPTQAGDGGESGKWWAAMTLVTQTCYQAQKYINKL